MTIYRLQYLGKLVGPAFFTYTAAVLDLENRVNSAVLFGIPVNAKYFKIILQKELTYYLNDIIL